MCFLFLFQLVSTRTCDCCLRVQCMHFLLATFLRVSYSIAFKTEMYTLKYLNSVKRSGIQHLVWS